MTEKSQDQTPIPLEDKEGNIVGVAVKTGNNAAWMCICGYRLPLIWSAFYNPKPTVCRECGRVFIGDNDKKSPDKIKEMK